MPPRSRAQLDSALAEQVQADEALVAAHDEDVVDDADVDAAAADKEEAMGATGVAPVQSGVSPVHTPVLSAAAGSGPIQAAVAAGSHSDCAIAVSDEAAAAGAGAAAGAFCRSALSASDEEDAALCAEFEAAAEPSDLHLAERLCGELFKHAGLPSKPPTEGRARTPPPPAALPLVPEGLMPAGPPPAPASMKLLVHGAEELPASQVPPRAALTRVAEGEVLAGLATGGAGSLHWSDAIDALDAYSKRTGATLPSATAQVTAMAAELRKLAELPPAGTASEGGEDKGR